MEKDRTKNDKLRIYGQTSRVGLSKITWSFRQVNLNNRFCNEPPFLEDSNL